MQPTSTDPHSGNATATAPDTVRYEPLRPDLLPRVVPFHRENLGGQLAGMGEAFVGWFYATALRLDGAFGWAACDDGGLAGFVFGSLYGDSLPARVVKRDPVGWACGAVRSAATHPLHALRVALAARGGPGRAGRSDRPELHFIAVSSRRRGRGIGAALLDRFRRGLRERGRTEFELSVGQDNLPANRFYEAQGGVALYEYEAAGEKFRRFLFREMPDHAHRTPT